MALPDKPLVIDLDAIGLDEWIAFAETSTQLQALKDGRDIGAIAQALKGARDVLIALLSGSDWTPEDVGRLNIAELKQVFATLSQGIHGPNAPSGSPSTPPSSTAGRSRSSRASAGSRKNGAAPRGRSHPSSA